MKALPTILVLFFVTVSVVSSAAVRQQLADCREVVTIRDGDSLKKLSEDFFGTDAYDRAILLATNARTASPLESGVQYISNPDKPPVGAKACIPPNGIADQLRKTDDSYRAAVAQMVLPQPSDVSDSLVSVDTRSAVRVVTWKRTNQLQSWKNPDGTWKTRAVSDTWVTIVPQLKSFCQAFLVMNRATTAQLTLRLEQRLGLPPASNNEVFVEMVVKEPSRYKNLFRPCIDPSVAAKTCRLGPIPDKLPENIGKKHRNWIYRQYYNSYAIAQPNQYPWTSLGYTFDWATDDSSRSKFVKVGESEFVVPKGASIEIQSTTSTAQYCSPQ